MAIVITFASEKGGVTKTSSCINISTCLAQRGYKVLLVDMDPQANSTYMLTGFKKKEEKFRGKGVYDMFRAYGIKSPADYIADSYIDENLKLLPSNASSPLAIGQLETLEKENGISRNKFLMYCLAEVADQFDFILCDTNPSRDTLQFSAIVASDYLIIPCVANDFSLDGLETTYALMRRLEQEENVEISLLGVVMNVVEKYSLTDFVRQQISLSDYGDCLFSAEVKKGQAANDSLTFGKPVVITAPKCTVSKGYMSVTDEMLERLNLPLKKPENSIK